MKRIQVEVQHAQESDDYRYVLVMAAQQILEGCAEEFYESEELYDAGTIGGAVSVLKAFLGVNLPSNHPHLAEE
jgi:hypothetical protein